MDFRTDQHPLLLIEEEIPCMEISSLQMARFISAWHCLKEIIGYP
jgi:hypothetical protein